jgi:acetyltransferase-like isoleucine patch superfamily enzyme
VARTDDDHPATASPPARRGAAALCRRALARAARARHRASTLRLARRSFALSNAEGVLALQEDARRHIAAGTLVMGRGSYFAPSVQRDTGDGGRVFVGNFASVAHDALFHCGGEHRTDWVAQFPLRERLGLPGAGEDGHRYGRGDIHVGHDTWITRGTVVLSGVTIGPGAVVATRSVVTQDVAPYAIVGGIPARQIGQRFADDQIAALLRIAWWDWPLETIRERVAQLTSPDVDDFIARYDPGPPAAG